ncbi:ABC transporter permease [Rhizobium sp. Leaf306]|uniref:ABC transporter permease n=1 Tax=Rhizobium sp. Leaf306 TaxID=1736330 RepID=UPI0007135290|nr:ABC transporter permease [Rhizobium sp. Leaf306]KQQ35689.1 ABC transporter permease [Rhizobium sp. Leaf306]
MDDQTQGGKTTRRRASIGSWGIRLGAISCFAVILAYFAFTAPGFLSFYNILNVVEQSAILGVLAFGMSVVIIGGGSDVQTGGIDLSLAANTGLCAAVFATTSNAGYPVPTAVLAVVATGLTVGLLNAIAVVRLNILPLLATLAVMNVVAGSELILTQNTVISVASEFVSGLAMGSFIGVSFMAWTLIVFTALMICVLHFTGIGLRLYAVGGHPEAARAAGIGVGRYLTSTYLFSGLCAAIASILLVSRLSASTPGSGELLLSVLAAALLGTVFSRRFVPTAGGTILSTLFIGFLANGFQLLNVSSYWVNGVQGTLILLVVAATSLAKPSER